MARATSSLPVPVSPVIRTVESVGATLDTRESTVCRGARSSDDLLEHRCLVDFFAQRDVLVLEPLLGLLAILDIGRGDIPTREASLFIPQRVIAEKKPAILPVFSP